MNLNNPDYGLIIAAFNPESCNRGNLSIEGTRFWELGKSRLAVVPPTLSRRGLLAGDSSRDELTNTNTIASSETMQTI